MKTIVGIDEVGRGCWAGPVVAAAVLLHLPLEGLTDSKLLTKRRREVLALEIKKNSSWAISFLPAGYVDSLGLTAAIGAAMKDALRQIQGDYDKVIIDGSYNFISNNSNVSTLIKADLTVAAVSAASIIAKVARDMYMAEQSILYPEYGFDKHVGYGTAKHRQAIKQHGVCELHRLSYKPIKVMLA